MFRFMTAGESHGQCLTSIIEGLPSGLYLLEEEINKELARRQKGYGRGGRMKIEKDQVMILSGVRGGYTLGSPVTLQIKNRDWENWEKYMSPGPDADLQTKRVTNPRPGHADLPGAVKYAHQDLRNILERSSARETAARVAVGAVARALLSSLGIHIAGQVLSIGEIVFREELSWEEINRLAPQSEVFCASAEITEKMKRRIDQAKKAGDTLGGIFEVVVKGLPVGLGSHVHWDRRLDGRLAQALMSIPAIKGVEIGWGFRAAQEPGSTVHDEIFSDGKRFFRRTNHAGGLEGGITNGELLVVRAAMKPIPTLMKPLWSVDFITKEPVQASVERSDVCAVPAALVVGEAAVAITLADALLEKYGGDHLSEIKYRVNYEQHEF